MSGIIIPGGNGIGVNPVLEQAKAEIGGHLVEYFVKPGAGRQITLQQGREMEALIACTQLLTLNGVSVDALVREAIIQRDAAVEAAAEAARDKAQLKLLVIRFDALSTKLDAHAGAIDELQNTGP